MVIRTAKGKVTTIDGREKAPRAMAPDSFIENGEPLPFDAARFSGLSAGVPGTPLTWDRALRQVRHDVAARGAAARHPGRHATASRSTRPSSIRRRRADLLRRRPLDRGDLPRPRRHPARRRRHPANADMAKTYRLLGARRRAQGLLQRPRRHGHGQRGGQPADRPDRRPHVAQGPDDRRRPRAATPRRSARRSRRSYRGLDRLRHGPAVQRRHHRRRGAEHPRRLRLRWARRASQILHQLPRGLALRVRRPRRLPGRSGVLRRAGRRASSRRRSPTSGAR